MLVYEGLKKDFMYSVESDKIAFEIERMIMKKMHRKTSVSEFRAFTNSLEYMYKVLNDNDIPNDSGVAIEYNIPQTSKRVDFIISGYDSDEKENAVIIELKQWDKIKEVDNLDALVETYTGGAVRQVVHPSYQAWSYAQVIRDYNTSVQNENIILNPCAYMHNYMRKNNDPIDSIRYSEYINEAPVFTMGQVVELRKFIKNHIVKGDNKEVIYKIENGRIKPSKSLQTEITSMIKGNKEFIMLDEQKVVYEVVLDIAKKSYNTNQKNVIIVEGGPGTGKSVLAINLLAELTNNDQLVQYVTKTSATRSVYLHKLKGAKTKTSVANMFKGSGQYTDVANNVIDTILVDEAHRLNEKSGMFKNLGENQIKEVIHSSKCSAFFIDENQRVTISDIGSVSEIEKWAKFYNAKITKMELVSQFRCNGSDGYLSLLDNVLEIKETANFDMTDIDYDIRIYDNPNEMRKDIIEKNNINNKSRIVAGYCWNWIKEGKNNTNIHDIVIDDFEMSWNLGNDTTFAISDTSIDQVGCIHTTQGLEFDYVGVIIGDDMRYDDGRIITDFSKRASTDQSIKGIKKKYKENKEAALKLADEIIKNTYRTLMTRGMKGCYVYCVDKELQEYLRSYKSIN